MDIFTNTRRVGAKPRDTILYISHIFYRICDFLFFPASVYLATIIRSQLRYAVTNQRILIRKGVFSKDLVSVDPKRLRAIELKANASGTGSLFFLGPDEELKTGFRALFQRQHSMPHSFEMIAEAASVHKLVSIVKRGEYDYQES